MTEARRIVKEVSLLAEPLLHECGLELVDTEFVFQNGRWILRIFIDKKGGVTLDDCASVSRELGDIIDASDTISFSYVLEISSPGLDRPLKKESDFIRSIGKLVKLKMAKPVNGRRNFTGRLAHVEEGMVRLLLEDNTLVELPLSEVSAAKLKYEFEN
jgi:ribosome maturation factor RimP